MVHKSATQARAPRQLSPAGSQTPQPSAAARIRQFLGRLALVTALVGGLSAVAVSLAGAASAATTDTLSAGQQLSAGQSLKSSDGRYTAIMQGDGNFVVYGPSGAGWNTGGGSANRIIMQSDGNLVAYNPSGGYTWSSGTATSRNDRLVMQSDGNLVIYSGNSIVLWSNGVRIQGADTLAAGQQLSVNQLLVSTDGRYTAIMQGDGNFVVYGPSGAGWNTGGGSANRIIMQSDGNLVAYNPSGGYTWSSSTAPSSGDRLVMQSDGNLVIYNNANTALWSNGQLLGGSGVQNFKAWALNRTNWNSTTPAGNPGIDSDGLYGAQCADLGIAWSKQAGHRVGFDGWDTSSVSKPGWHYVSGSFGAAQPGDVITRVGGKQHVVVVVGSPSGGVISVLQQNPGSPAVANYSTSTSGVIWRLN